jgi:uncharacterized membrane protein
MAEGAALNEYGEVPQHIRDKIKAHAAACDNIASERYLYCFWRSAAN